MILVVNSNEIQFNLWHDLYRQLPPCLGDQD